MRVQIWIPRLPEVPRTVEPDRCPWNVFQGCGEEVRARQLLPGPPDTDYLAPSTENTEFAARQTVRQTIRHKHKQGLASLAPDSGSVVPG